MSRRYLWVGVILGIWLIAGVVFLFSYRLWDWRVLTGFATWILAAGIGAAIWQIRQARQTTNVQFLTDFYWKFRDDEVKLRKLREIYKLSPENLNELTSEQSNNIDYVLDWLDTLGAIVMRDFVDREVAMEVFAGLPALRCWYKLCGHIKKVRDARGYYAESVEAFTKLTLDYFTKHHIPAKLDSVDLIRKLQEKEFKPRNIKEIKRDRGR